MNNKITWIDRGWYIILEFEQSSSPIFNKVLTLARSGLDYSEIVDETGKIIYRNIFRKEQIEQFVILFEFVKNWRSVSVYVKGDKLDRENLTLNGINCYIEKIHTSAEYCTNILSTHFKDLPDYFGCFRSRLAINPYEWKPWFSYGDISRDEEYYYINKKLMLESVYNNLAFYEECPDINWDIIKQMISILPDTIEIHSEPRWHYHYIKGIVPDDINSYKEYMKNLLSSFLSF